MPAKAKALDFTNVKERNFNTKHLPDGDYAARITKVSDEPSKEGNDMWTYTITLTSGSVPGAKGCTYPYYCVLNPDNLWKLRNLFAAAGINVPKKRVNTDPNKVINKDIGVTLGSDEYQGKMKSVIEQVLPLSEIDEVSVDDDEDEAPAAKTNGDAKAAKKAKKNKAKKEASDDDELEELEVEDL